MSCTGSKPHDTLIVFLKEFFSKINLEKSADDNKSWDGDHFKTFEMLACTKYKN